VLSVNIHEVGGHVEEVIEDPVADGRFEAPQVALGEISTERFERLSQVVSAVLTQLSDPSTAVR
jgi:hypothetical protein